MVKCIEDALRAFEILKDDSPPFVTRTIIESSKIDFKKGPAGERNASQKDNKKGEDYVEIIINQI